MLDPAADISGCTSGFPSGEAGERLQAAVECARGAHVVLDAMTGIGVVGALRGVAARWLRLWVWMACCRTSLRCRTMTLR